MTTLNTIAILITLTAVFGYLNHRFIRLPTTIGVMLVALLFSLTLILVGQLGDTTLILRATNLLRGIDFEFTLMQGMLSFLLFAGALHVNLEELAKQKWVVLTLATLGVVISTFIIGVITWLILSALNLNVSLIYCLLFGALISPTDPVAVLSILKTTQAPPSLAIKIGGESLFNDGVGVVVFLVLLGIATGTHTPDVGTISLLFLQEAIGGAVFGLAIGALSFYMLKTLDNYQVEILITLALVMGGYALATLLHVSGPIAMVVAGLIIGNHGRKWAMSDMTREHLDTFWELIDEVMNAVLFTLIGLEVLIVSMQSTYLLAVLAILPVVVLARYCSVGLPVLLMRRIREFTPNVIEIMTWGGLRGGISVAMALSLPLGMERDLILTMTYAVVVASILIQGLTIGRVIRSIQ